MLNIRHFGFLFFLWCNSQAILASPSGTLLQDVEEVNKLDEKLIDSLINTDLQNTLRVIVKDQITRPISKQEATNLLLATMEESREKVLELITFLLSYFNTKNYLFDKHKVMLKALDLAPVEAVKYLLEKNVFNKAYLGQQHDNFLFRLDKLHIAKLLLIDSFYIALVPSFITKLWGIISSIRSSIWVLSWISTSCDNLYQWIDGYIAHIRFLFSLKWFMFFYGVRILISLYKVIMVSKKPNYLFALFMGDIERKSTKELEEKALLLLKHGANPHAKVLLVEKQKQLMQLMQLPEDLNLYSYSTLSLLHLATQHNMLTLVKVLIKAGANINAVALSMKDTINYPDKHGKMTTLLPFQFVSVNDLYYGGEKSIKQTPLDLAPNGSNTAQYLKEHGGKYYRELQPIQKAKKPSPLVNKNH